MQENQAQYDEISLRELIETLLKHKKVIIIITTILVLLSGIISFFVMKPVYEAKTVLMASQITDKIMADKKGEGIEGILSDISEYPQLTIETYKEQIKSPVILEEIIKELGLAEKGLTRNNISNMISLETIKNTNLITIKVKNTDKELATKIANTLSSKFIDFISSQAKGKTEKSLIYFTQQLETEKQKLDEALLEYKDFLAQPRGVQELNSEIGLKSEELNTYKDELSKEETNYQKSLLSNKAEEKTLVTLLEKSQEKLEATSEKLITKRSLAGDNFLSEVIKDEAQLKQKDIASIEMYSEQINPNYISMDSKVTNLEVNLSKVRQQRENIKYTYEGKMKILSAKTQQLKSELEKLRVELAEKQHQEKIVTRKVGLAQSTYNALTSKYEEARIAQSSTVGDASIIIVSPAVEPINPVAPNKKLNVAIAGVLGIMIGAFIAFFRAYWENSSEEVVSSK